MDNVESLDTHSNLFILIDVDNTIRNLSKELNNEKEIENILISDRQRIK